MPLHFINDLQFFLMLSLGKDIWENRVFVELLARKTRRLYLAANMNSTRPKTSTRAQRPVPSPLCDQTIQATDKGHIVSVRCL
jgi:hypothetical protein